MLEILITLTLLHWLVIICVIAAMLNLIAAFRMESRIRTLEFDVDNLYDFSEKSTKVINMINEQHTPEIKHLKDREKSTKEKIEQLEKDVEKMQVMNKLL